MNAALHQRVETALRARQCDVGAAECHGMLCGMLSGPRAFDASLWLGHVFGDTDNVPASDSVAGVALDEMAATTRAALRRDDFAFDLLLPDASAALDERIGAFSAWCRGYLSGLGLSGLVELSVLGDDARGFLHDVERFCAIGATAEITDDDERALVELTEFTRMGVMIVRAEAGAVPEASPGQPQSLH